MKILVTGGCGFIGSAVVRHLIHETDHHVVNVDKMTYAATHGAVALVESDTRYQHEIVDICDPVAVAAVFKKHRPDSVMHLAAESHVDRSIDGPAAFIHTNIVGTFNLLEAARRFDIDRFHHVSTDEVFGSLGLHDEPFTEDSAYAPHSPYSASKAGSDHLAMAWWHSYGLPVVLTNCSNNYGPFQFPEKLIPLMIIRALAGETLPVYGTGENVRDWLYVEDHARALVSVVESGTSGETYNVGGSAERSNIDVVHRVCDILDDRVPPLATGARRRSLVEFTNDRPGHDLRYAIDQRKIETELGWRRVVTFDEGLAMTVDWFLENEAWWRPLLDANATRRQGLSETTS